MYPPPTGHVVQLSERFDMFSFACFIFFWGGERFGWVLRCFFLLPKDEGFTVCKLFFGSRWVCGLELIGGIGLSMFGLSRTNLFPLDPLSGMFLSRWGFVGSFPLPGQVSTVRTNGWRTFCIHFWSVHLCTWLRWMVLTLLFSPPPGRGFHCARGPARPTLNALSLVLSADSSRSVGRITSSRCRPAATNAKLCAQS